MGEKKFDELKAKIPIDEIKAYSDDVSVRLNNTVEKKD